MVSFLGSVDYFDGKRLDGWAMDTDDPSRTVSVEIYVDDLRVATVAADRFRDDLLQVSPDDPSKSFSHAFDPPLCAEAPPLVVPTTPKIAVKFAGSDIQLHVNPDLFGLVNESFLDPAERVCMWSDSRFLPTPDRKMIAHVAGDGTTPQDYRAVGMYLLLDLLHYGLILDRNASVVDVGCGCGRLAAHLAPILGNEGRYQGFDTWAKGIDWAKKNISSVYPSFRFERLGSTRWSKDPGYVGEAAFELSVEDGSCDAVVAASLFTHLSFDAALHYLKEFARILKPSGRAYITFFIHNEEAQRLLARQPMRPNAHGAVFQHRDYFDMFFTEDAIASLLGQAGLEAMIKRYGYWRGNDTGGRRRIGFQDLLILRRSR
jgi:ubiquinone/menaquinone biosynthesis C-methylase UbiE